jgi:hypothetical protein
VLLLSLSNISLILSLEALAVREAMALAEDLYVQKIQVASDCKIVVDEIKQGSAGNHAAIVHEITDRSNAFTACSFVHEFRSSNFEAHSLARHALSLGVGRRVWLGLPGDLNFLLVNVSTT